MKESVFSPESPSRKPLALDLFAGAGGTGRGFMEAGFEIVSAVELEPSAVKTYRANIRCPVEEADIRSLDPVAFRARLGLLRRELEVLIGCPPCQGFSRMRNGKGAGDKRNDLLLHYLQFLEEFEPAYAFFENVRGLMAGEHGRIFHTALKQGLANLGYAVTERCVDAADYGVPQHRERLILVAGRDGRVPPFPVATHGDPKCDSVKHGFRAPWVTVRDAIGGLPTPEAAANDRFPPNHIAAVIGPSVLDFIRRVPQNGGGRLDVPREYWLPCHLKHSGHADVYGRCLWDRPSNTAGCVNVSKGRFVHPEADRGLTYREAALLQGFPVFYVFFGDKVGAQIGNAVPPPLARAVALSILERLNTNSHRHEFRTSDPGFKNCAA
jgi:DNA (cytosine-5)-methyltransferase 1